MKYIQVLWSIFRYYELCAEQRHRLDRRGRQSSLRKASWFGLQRKVQFWFKIVSRPRIIWRGEVQESSEELSSCFFLPFFFVFVILYWGFPVLNLWQVQLWGGILREKEKKETLEESYIYSLSLEIILSALPCFKPNYYKSFGEHYFQSEIFSVKTFINKFYFLVGCHFTQSAQRSCNVGRFFLDEVQ